MVSPHIVLRGQAAAPRVVALCVFLAAAPVARAQSSDPPSPTSPSQAVELLKWCWEHRDAARYRELFTADFHFVTRSEPDSLWSRDEELHAVTALFGAGVPDQPGATAIALAFQGDFRPGSAHLPEA